MIMHSVMWLTWVFCLHIKQVSINIARGIILIHIDVQLLMPKADTMAPKTIRKMVPGPMILLPIMTI